MKTERMELSREQMAAVFLRHLIKAREILDEVGGIRGFTEFLEQIRENPTTSLLFSKEKMMQLFAAKEVYEALLKLSEELGLKQEIVQVIEPTMNNIEQIQQAIERRLAKLPSGE